MAYLQVELAAKKRIPKAAVAAGVQVGVIAWGLLELWEHVWESKNAIVGEMVIDGCFGPSAKLRDALVAFGFLEEVGGSYRVRGAERYLRISQARSEGGKKAAGNLRRGLAEGSQPELVPGSSREGAGEEPGRSPGCRPALTSSIEHRASKEEEARESKSADADPPAPVIARIASPEPDPSELQGVWNEHAHPSLPRWREMSSKRRASAKARMRERPISGESGWFEVIRRINASSFLRGETERGWKASPDWLLQPDTAAKVLEGKYDDRGQTPTPPLKLYTGDGSDLYPDFAPIVGSRAK